MDRQPHHAGNDHQGGGGLDDQGAAGEVLAQPRGTKFREQQRGDEDDGEAYTGNCIDNRRMRKADRIKSQKRAHAVDEAVDEVPESAARIGSLRVPKDLSAPWPRDEQQQGGGARAQRKKDIAAHKIGFAKDDSLKNIYQAEEQRGERHRDDHFAELHLLGEEHQESAAGEQRKGEHLASGKRLLKQEE